MKSGSIEDELYPVYVVVNRDQGALWKYVREHRLGFDFGDNYLMTLLLGAADRGHAFDLLFLFEWVLQDRGYKIVYKGLDYPGWLSA